MNFNILKCSKSVCGKTDIIIKNIIAYKEIFKHAKKIEFKLKNYFIAKQ